MGILDRLRTARITRWRFAVPTALLAGLLLAFYRHRVGEAAEPTYALDLSKLLAMTLFVTSDYHLPASPPIRAHQRNPRATNFSSEHYSSLRRSVGARPA